MDLQTQSVKLWENLNSSKNLTDPEGPGCMWDFRTVEK